MGKVAQGEITLSTVNDAYTVSLTPATVVVSADFDGSHPKLENARSILSVKRGGKAVLFKIVGVDKSEGVTLQDEPDLSTVQYQFQIIISSIPTNVQSGYVELTILASDGSNYTTTARYTYTVNRESSMLDWITDWEGSKTKIGDSYIMTPKLFIGKKEDVSSTTIVNGEEVVEWKRNAITGVYIGPDLLSDETTFSAGLYGYRNSQEIFHLNEEGGMIGGWHIENGGLQTADGKLKILSEGSIEVKDGDDLVWKISKDGEAVFARGNVVFNANGDAYFSGEISTTTGNIGGWTITEEGIISPDENLKILSDGSIKVDLIWSLNSDGSAMFSQGKVFFHRNGDASFEGEVTATSGSIGGWLIEDGIIKSEDKKLRLDAEGSIQSKLGIHTYWSINSDGSARFAQGKVLFYANGDASFEGTITSTSGNIGGWTIDNNFLNSGSLYLSSSGKSIAILSNQLVTRPNSDNVPTLSIPLSAQTGGLMMYHSSDTDYGLVCYKKDIRNPTKLFSVGSTNIIAGWKFNEDSMYLGDSANNTANAFSNSTGSITLGTNGIRGYKWRLESSGAAAFAGGLATFNADGSGSIANGNISWNANGTVTFSESVSLNWTSAGGDIGNKLTYIGSDGVYTGTISASNVTAGTLIGSTIQQAEHNPKWKLNSDGSGFVAYQTIRWYSDGSGYIADGNISWDADGVVTFADNVSLNWNNISGAIGNKLTKIDAEGIYTGTISASNITGGTIVGVTISQRESLWRLNPDGSGWLAAAHINWDAEGNLAVHGTIYAGDGRFAGNIVTSLVDINDSDALALRSDGSVHIIQNNLRIVDHGGGHEIVLPRSDDYIGARILILCDNFVSSRTDGTTHVRTENLSKILGVEQNAVSENVSYGFDEVWFQAGTVEFLCFKYNNVNRWAVISKNAAVFHGENN